MSSYRMKYKIGATQYHIPVTDDILGSGGGMVNTWVEITTSQTWTAPIDGWYRFVIKGGGGGGAGAGGNSSTSYAGPSGGEAGTTIAYHKLGVGDTVTIVIGAGGAGGSIGDNVYTGGNGGNSTVTIGSTVYTGGGGGGAQSRAGGIGGTGTIPGIPGFPLRQARGVYLDGNPGVGHGGNISIGDTGNPSARKSSFGAGGCGGTSYINSVNTKGADGGDGFCWIEYFNPSL